jgi:hypothetical protein
MIITVEQLDRQDGLILPFNKHVVTPSRVWRNAAPISNTISESILQSIELSGDELINGSAVLLDMSNTILNASGSASTFRFRVYVQDVVVYDDTSPALSFGPGLIAQSISLRFLIDAAAWSVHTCGSFLTGGRGLASTGIAGDLSASGAMPSTPFVGNSVNYRIGDLLKIKITVEMSVANPNLQYNNIYNQLQIITG